MRDDHPERLGGVLAQVALRLPGCGGYLGPVLDVSPNWLAAILGLFYFTLKTVFFLVVMIWVRATLPRLRYDQLMRFGWKVMLPLALANVAVTAVAMVVFAGKAG